MQLIVFQMGGLGNQLFQYAAGRYFSDRYGASLLLALDPTCATSYGFPRPFLLSNFRISAGIRSYNRVDRYRVQPPQHLRGLFGFVNRFQQIQTYTEALDQRYTFIPDIEIDDDVHSLYIMGFWQAYQFAESIADQLRTELVFRDLPQSTNLKVLDKIRATRNSISLHIRRCDYTLPSEGNIALPISYYNRAIDFFDKAFASPTYFVFSDDIEFAKKSLAFSGEALFIDHNDSFTAQEDLRLMSACENHIIANSTFSWWAAWLNPKVDKLVYAPKYWLLKRKSYYKDLFPPSWILDENLDGAEVDGRQNGAEQISRAAERSPRALS